MDKQNVVHIYSGNYSAINNEIMPLVATWLELEMIILSEVRQTNIMISFIMCNLKK